jgi:hypothetical protein
MNRKPFRRPVRFSDLTSSPERWREFETNANERAYSRYMAELEEGDAARDERERRQEVDDDEMRGLR